MIYETVLAWQLQDNLVLKGPVTMSLFDTYFPGKRFMFFWKIEATLNVFPHVISMKWNTELYYQWISLMIIINGWPYFHSHDLNSPRLMFLSVDVLLWILTIFTYQLTLVTKQSCHSHYVFLMQAGKLKCFGTHPNWAVSYIALYKIPLAQACFPLTRPNFHLHWRAGEC